MSAALVTILAAAAESCPELEAWLRCEAHWEHCGDCALRSPERCESEVIKALARRLSETRSAT